MSLPMAFVTELGGQENLNEIKFKGSHDRLSTIY